MNFNYVDLDSLNRAKSKINNLLMQKYSNEKPIRVKNNDSDINNKFFQIADSVERLRNIIIQLRSAIVRPINYTGTKKIKEPGGVTKRGKLKYKTREVEHLFQEGYARSFGLYTTFSQKMAEAAYISQNVQRLIRNLNQNQNVNLVSPNFVQEFFSNFINFEQVYTSFREVAFKYGGKFIEKFKTGLNGNFIDDDETENIDRMFEQIRDGYEQLKMLNDNLENNYNYEGQSSTANFMPETSITNDSAFDDDN